MSAIQDQLQLRRSFGQHALSIGGYFANYTQDNHWNFTQILTDVRDNPRFLDLVVTPPGGAPDSASPRTASGTSSPSYPTDRARPRSSRAWWAARSSSRSGSAPTSASGWSTTTSCRARRTRRRSTWTADPPRRSTTRIRQQQLPPLQPEHHRLGRARSGSTTGSTRMSRSMPRAPAATRCPHSTSS